MKLIDDKEVGKIFRYWIKQRESARQRPSYSKDFYEANQVCHIIRKLVNEEYLRQLGCFDSQQQRQAIIKKDCQNEALKRYRIDPADWKDDD